MTATCTYVVTYMFLDAHADTYMQVLVSTLRAAYSVTVKDISYS